MLPSVDVMLPSLEATMLRLVTRLIVAVVVASCAAAGPTPATPAKSGAAVPAAGLSPRRDTCARDEDCELYNSVNERVGQPGGPSGCCVDSRLPATAASRDWVTELDRFCAAMPPGPCPGGNQPPSRAACQAGRCVVAHVPSQ